MCVVSNIGDSFRPSHPWKDNDFPWVEPKEKPWKELQEFIKIPEPPEVPEQMNPLQEQAMRDWLKKLDKILVAAKAFDEATGQPDCEQADKMKALKELAEAYDVQMEFFS